MARRLLIGLVLVLAVASIVSSAAADPSSRKESVDARISTLRDRAAAAQAREQELENEVADLAQQIQGLDTQVRDVSARLEALERDLELHREKLARLQELFRVQTQRLRFLRHEYRTAVLRLDRRLVAMYQSEDVGTLEIVLTASSFSQMLDQLDYMKDIGSQDKAISETVHDAKVAMRIARQKTRKTKAIVAAATRAIAVRTIQVRQLRDELVARESALAAARSQKRSAAVDAHESAQEALDEAAALLEVSAALADQIRAAQAAAAAAAAARESSSSSPSSSSSSSSAPSSTGGVSSSGFIWPVSGPVVSGFGYRCLHGICRMHEGIDIGVGYGTAIHAVASGTVIYAGWMGGYGNLIVVDHGGGVSTAYAHQSSFAVTGGRVSQGQVIGYVGCTGHCFGPHLHFEVRVNGSAVDPLGYL